MSKQASFSGWVCVIPDKMIASWVKKKYLPSATELDFGEVEEGSGRNHWDLLHRMSLMDKKGCTKDFIWAKTQQEINKYKKLKYKFDCLSVRLLDTEVYDIMRGEVHDWYKNVFDYVEKWLRNSDLLRLKKGDIQTGFCVETDPNHDVVKRWNAPLAMKGNKVVQVKEKFGRITVYFGGTTQEEWESIQKFAKGVEKKFDCEVFFA